MKYASCGDSSFTKKYDYCAADAQCTRLVKKLALWRRITDSRDGTVCSNYVASCPC